MNKAIAIIQARMSSSRLPGKVMKDLAGYPMIWHIYQRALKCELVEKVIVATSTDSSDNELVEYCEKNNLNVFRGSLSNVLGRFIQILNQEKYDYFVRITGDCPLIHPNFIDQQITALNQFDGDLVWAPNLGSLYEGQGVMSGRSLKYISQRTDDLRDLEHVGSNYIANQPYEFKIVDFKIPERLIFSNFRITVDEEKDYELMQMIYNKLWKGSIVKLVEVVKLLLEREDLKIINKEIKHRSFNLEVEEKKSRWHDVKKVGVFQYSDISFEGIE